MCKEIKAYKDKNGEIWKRVLRNSKIEWEHLKPLVGCIAVYDDCPMKHPVKRLTPEELYNYIYLK